MAKYTLYRNGELVAVTSDDSIVQAAVSRGIDLSSDGRRVTKDELAEWKKREFLKLMSEAISKGAKVHKTAQASMMRIVNQMSNAPIHGSFKPLSESKALAAWLEFNNNMLPSDKVAMLLERLWLVLTGGNKRPEDTTIKDAGSREMFLEVLSVIITTPNAINFMNAAFSMSTSACQEFDSVEVPEPLRPLFDVCSNVDGRGEVLATFLFKDVLWLPGTGRHDLLGLGDSEGNWHVKENIGSKARMGSNRYATSDICTKLQMMNLKTDGFADIRHSISKSFIDANEEALNKEFGNFYDAMDVAFRASEKETRGIIFFKRDSVIVRRTNDTRCIGSTKGDFVVRPLTTVTKDENVSQQAS